VVGSRASALERDAAASGWWPQDRLICSYLVVSGLLIAAFGRQAPGAVWMLGLHAVAAAALAAVVNQEARPGTVLWLFRHWYPLPYVVGCYKEMAILIPAVRGRDVDAAVARLDFAFWGLHPTVWLERLQTPLLTECMQIIYTLFLPMMLLVAVILWRRGRLPEFRFYAFLLSLGFLLSYVGYFLVPVRGPRFLLDPLQSVPLEGLWSFPFLRHLLDVVEAAHYDCFPSGHAEMILLAWWSSRRLSRRLYGIFTVYTVLMVFSTVYLRYHYTVDLAAGAALAGVLVFAAPRVYGCEKGRELAADPSCAGS